MLQSDPSSGVRSTAFAPGGFVHLHLHTEYSLLDGGNRIDRLVARVKELGMPAVGITDHGNIFGAVAFYQACRAAGVKPILGVEAYVAPGDRRDRTYTGVSDGGYHLVLLAENDEGWRNLLVLCSEAYLTGFYFKPRIDRELLAKHSAGLIAVNGHLGSEIGDHLLAYVRTRDEKHWNAAVESAQWHARVFSRVPQSFSPSPPSFFIELQCHVPEQNSINPQLVRLARELGLPLLADNDAHFLRPEDHDAHDTLICISTAKGKDDAARMRYSPELYVKSPSQMRALADGADADFKAAWAEGCDNTLRVAERCHVTLPLDQNHTPAVRVNLPAQADLPGHDDPRFAGDLSAWYRAFCERFEVVPFLPPSGADEAAAAGAAAEAKGGCDSALRRLAEAGFVWRYGAPGAAAADSRADADRADKLARLERELKILADKGISAYFLIVWDFVNWGRQQGIPALARGSGVGTMVGYVIGLSNACPVRYGLLFERFTDPDRAEYPDIDIDLCQDGRSRVITYVRAKYGHVAQIITFGTLKARAAIRDVARALGVSLPVADRIAKLVPEQLNITIDEALAAEPELTGIYEGKAQALTKINDKLGAPQHVDAAGVRRLIDNARTLEGQARHASVHAAGVIVATRPLREIVPLYKQPNAGEHEIVTQWDGPTCEKLGLLKMDFLGLRTISVVERAKAMIRETLPDEEVWRAVGRPVAPGPECLSAHPLDLDRLAFDDPAVFALFQRGETTGVFQFESPGMRRLLVEMRPDRLEDLIAANALFRPGPMDLIPDYVRRKHGSERVPAVHPLVDRHTAETYGVMVYQEQVMQIVHGLGGIGLRDAYTLIKNISKKKHDKIEKERPKFIKGAQSKGLTGAQADELFELILKFAGYGFNKSHSTGYAIVAYQTAYLKTYFPNQYMAAFLSYESAASSTADWAPYLDDCKRARFVNGKVGIDVRPPDINLSRRDFAVVHDPGTPRDALHGTVRFGLGAIKGVGDKAIDAIVAERDAHGPFRSLFDLCARAAARGAGVLTKTAAEALVKAGAMDALHGRGKRAAMTATIERALAAAAKDATDRAAGQGSLFGGDGSAPSSPSPHDAAAPAGADPSNDAAPLASAAPWSEAEAMLYEKEVLGFYVSNHPLDAWAAWAAAFTTAACRGLPGLRQDARVVLAGVVQSVRTMVVKRGPSAGQKMASVTFEDRTGTVQSVIFSDAYSRYQHLLVPDSVVFLLGRIDLSRSGSGGPQRGEGPDSPTPDGAGQPQVMIERLVPIDGVPLLPGRLRVRVPAATLNGEGVGAVESLHAALRAHRATEVHDAATDANVTAIAPAPPHQAFNGHAVNGAADRARFPIDLAIETAGGSVLVEIDRSWRLSPTPALIQDVCRVLGPGSVRVVGGVAVEPTAATGQRGRWSRERAAS